MVIEAPLEAVWGITNDIESWPRLFTEYAAAEVLKREGSVVRFRLTTHPDEEGRVWSWVSERTLDPAAGVVTARRIETGPFLEYMNLRWEYEEVPDGTRLRWIQEFQVRPDAPVDDHGAEDHLNEQTQKEMIHIKAVIEKR
ncbi:putative polyketide cyclase [Sinosporangium siamense]|uniref:Polyketide cyclase n=1 Tax=Sinosporangium siamense TaxID=1367973 RepID=A0A919V9A0_9ACTN|nr:putative polyketide cyclase [Sinosporangium siamense]